MGTKKIKKKRNMPVLNKTFSEKAFLKVVI